MQISTVNKAKKKFLANGSSLYEKLFDLIGTR